MTESAGNDCRRRGQLVLVAAGIIAVAMVPILMAYLQLGYAGDVRASDEYTDPAENAERVLSRAVHNASAGISGEYSWGQRVNAVDEMHARLDPRLATLESARVARGTAYQVSYHQSAATRWASEHCPGGDGRVFGPCRARNGVVVQNRAGETHVVAVAFEVTVTVPQGSIEESVVVRAIGGVDR